jgi:hypothetical protein
MTRRPNLRRLVVATALAVAGLCGVEPILIQAQAPATAVRLPQLNESDIRTWLTHLSSDLMQGRGVFTEGYGLASAYVAGELRALGVKPMGDQGTYFQSLTKGTYRADRRSSITISTGGTTQTFVHGDHVSFPLESGGRQTLTFTGVEFAGAGPAGEATGFSALGRNVAGKLVLYIPAASAPGRGGRGRTTTVAARSTHLVETERAAAVIAFAANTDAPPPGGGRGQGPSFSTVLPVDAVRAPVLTADETIFRALLDRAPMSFDDLQARASRGDALPMFSLPDVSVTIAVDQSYEVVRKDLTQNVVAMVEGSDPVLKDTYVFFGAHLDHVGYSTGSETQGRVNTPLEQDRIWNGADDDGSGSAALLALAKAFQQGPRPKRSVVFVWHAGEEEGLLGSEYMAAYPVVPLDRIQAQLNIDMIGRNRDDDPKQADTLYVIGQDRISTDLHNLIVDTNASQPAPLTLDYEFNDARDPNRFYVRSDHYSYAVKGIPIAFFFTGTHPDYHANTDTVDKILFPKLRRIAQFIYEAGFRIASAERPLVRDNRGARAGRGFSGRLD